VSLEEDASGLAMGTVSFGGITKRVCLACVPDVAVDEYVVVHAGFAISKVDERQAGEVFRLLEEIAGASDADAGAQEPD
jgi:hydrogenase expression/formation protein HypC